MFKRGIKIKNEWVCLKCKQEQTTYDGAYDRIGHKCCGSTANLELLKAGTHNIPNLR